MAHAGSSQWTYLTNHAHVLLAIARDHDVRLREIASQVGITERAVQKIIAELEDAGALTKSRDGRRNHYEVNTEVSLRHPMEAHRTLDSLVRMVLEDAAAASNDVAYMANGNGNGHANGHVNGMTNGFANGRLLGVANGHSNGHTNGHTNGHSNGLSFGNSLTNGHTNGHSNGNGSSSGQLS